MCAASNNEEGLAARSDTNVIIILLFLQNYVAHRHDIFAH